MHFCSRVWRFRAAGGLAEVRAYVCLCMFHSDCLSACQAPQNKSHSVTAANLHTHTLTGTRKVEAIPSPSEVVWPQARGGACPQYSPHKVKKKSVQHRSTTWMRPPPMLRKYLQQIEWYAVFSASYLLTEQKRAILGFQSQGGPGPTRAGPDVTIFFALWVDLSVQLLLWNPFFCLRLKW